MSALQEGVGARLCLSLLQNVRVCVGAVSNVVGPSDRKDTMRQLLWMVPLMALLTACTPKPQYVKLYEFQFVAPDGRRLSVICLHGSRADTPLPGTYECDIGERVMR